MGKEDAPNYRQAEGDANCSHCRFNDDGVCALYHFAFDRDYVCDSWQPMMRQGAILAFMPTPEEARQMLSALDGQGENPNDLHLTLVALGMIEDLPEKQSVVNIITDTLLENDLHPVQGVINGVGMFMGEEQDVLYASYDAPDLPAFRQALVSGLQERGIEPATDHGFIPHITLLYTEEPEMTLDLSPMPMTFNSLVLMWGEERILFPLATVEERLMKRGNDLASVEEERAYNIFKRFFSDLKDIFSPKSRKIKDVDSWSGAASNYSTTEAYCSACLIDVNAAAGRDDKVQSHCMLPVRTEGDGSGTFVRQAVYAAAGGRGITQVKKPDDVSQDDWDTVVTSAANTIISVYVEMDETAPDSVYELAGKEPPESRAHHEDDDDTKGRAVSMSDVWERLWVELDRQDMEHGTYSWPVDIFMENDMVFAIVAREGKLFKVPLTMQAGDTLNFGEAQEVTQIFMPKENRTIVRQVGDKVRVIQVVATATLNRVAEIDTTLLFDSFIDHAEETGEYPLIDFLHYNQIVLGRAIALFRDEYCYIAVWEFDDTPLGRAAAEGYLADPEYWGSSIEFKPLQREMVEVAPGVTVPAYTKGINSYITVGPEEMVASWFTSEKVVSTRSRVMKKKDKEALTKLVGEDLAEETVEMSDQVNTRIKDEGMIARAADTDVADTDAEELPEVEDVEETQVETETEETPEEGDVSVIELDDDTARALASVVAESEGLQTAVQRAVDDVFQDVQTKIDEAVSGLQDTVTALQERLEALEADDEEQRQRWLDELPSRTIVVRGGHRPREVRELEAEEDDDANLADAAGKTLQKWPEPVR